MFFTRKLPLEYQSSLRVLFLVGFSLPLFGAAGDGRPANETVAQSSNIIKLDVKLDVPRGNSIYLGDAARIKIGLLDAKNNRIRAPKDLTLTVLARSEKGDTLDKKEVTIKSGEDTVSILLAPSTQTGVVEVQVKHPELLEGGTLFYVKSRPQTPPAPRTRKPRRPPAETSRGERGGVESPTPWDQRSGLPVSVKVSFAAGPSDNTRWRSIANGKDEITSRPVNGASNTQDDDFVLLFRKMPPERDLLADGRDAAEISVVLNPAPREDVKIFLSASAGRLDPTTLLVRSGQSLSDSPAKLTLEHRGRVRVRYDRSDPQLRLHANDELEVNFVAPITSVGFDAAPRQIPLIDSADIIVKLYDNNHEPVNTDQERNVSFELNSSNGSLEQKSISIKPGTFEGRTIFVPTARGRVVISAFIEGFPKQDITIEVTTPLLLLFLSSIGGLTGGFIAYRTRRQSKWRVPIGMITGFMLYWASLFGLISHLPRLTVLNEISAFALPLLGGWLGTEVFTITLKKLGIVS